MAIGEIHKFDIGVQFKVLVMDENNAVKDLSGATVKRIVFQKPSGVSLAVDAIFFTDGTDGYLTYDTVENDLDEAGLWRIQVYLEFGADEREVHSDIGDFRVYKNLG